MLKTNAEVRLNNRQDICLIGRVDLTNVVGVYAKVKDLLVTMPVVRIDLADIESADSSCLALLVECIRYAKTQHKDVSFYNMPQFMLDLGRVCGLDSILPLHKPLTFH